MTISRDIKHYLETEDFDALEDEWLGRMAEGSADLGYFVGIARALVGSGEEERSRFLLEMLDEHLKEHGRWETRLALLRRAGSLLLDPEAFHPEILATLETLHGDAPSFAGLVKAVRLDKAPHDLEKTWEKVDRLRQLVPFAVGVVVWMAGKGAGRVIDVNLELESLKVDFERARGLTVGFRAAPKLLEILDSEHVLRRKIEEPEVLAGLARSDPPELLRVVLTSFDRPLTANEIRTHLAGIVDEGGWTSWWGAARKHPQVVAHGSGRHTYTWLASQEDAVEAVWNRFAAADPATRLNLLKKEGARDPELASRMVEELASTAREAVEDDPGLTFEVACALERDSGAGQAPEDLPAPADLVRDSDPKLLLRGISDRGWKERGYTLVRQLRDDWPEVYAAQLGEEEDARLLDVLADALAAEAPQALWRFTDAIAGQPHKNPAAFTWLAERAAEDETLRARSPLRLLQQLFACLVDKRFVPYRQRLVKLVESGGTAPRLLDHLEPRHAAQAEEVIHRAAGLESYQRDALTNALHLRFPVLRGEDAQQVIYSTPEAIAARRKELENLVKRELPANRKAIEEARALGDLRENFEYKAARQRHEYLSSRQAQLERDLTLARPIDVTRIDLSEVRIGSRVELARDGSRRTITILGPWDSKPEDNVLAYESDLAQSLLGKKVGDEVEAGGATWEIASIGRYTEG